MTDKPIKNNRQHQLSRKPTRQSSDSDKAISNSGAPEDGSGKALGADALMPESSLDELDLNRTCQKAPKNVAGSRHASAPSISESSETTVVGAIIGAGDHYVIPSQTPTTTGLDESNAAGENVLSLVNWINEWSAADVTQRHKMLEQISQLPPDESGNLHTAGVSILRELINVHELAVRQEMATTKGVTSKSDITKDDEAEKSNRNASALLSDFKSGTLKEGMSYTLTIGGRSQIVYVLSRSQIKPEKETVTRYSVLKINEASSPPSVISTFYISSLSDIVVSQAATPAEIIDYLAQSICNADDLKKQWKALEQERLQLQSVKAKQESQLEERAQKQERERQDKFDDYNRRITRLSDVINQWKDAEEKKEPESILLDRLDAVDKALKSQPDGAEGDEMRPQWDLIRTLWDGTRIAEKSRINSVSQAKELVADWKKLKDSACSPDRQHFGRRFIEVLKSTAPNESRETILDFLTRCNASRKTQETSDNALFYVIDAAKSLEHDERQWLFELFEMRTLVAFAKWLQSENKSVGVDLLDTLSEHFARQFRREAAGPSPNFDHHREFSDVLFDLINLLESKTERAPYYWRLFCHMREAWERLAANSQGNANDTGGAHPYMEGMLDKIPYLPEPLQFLMLRSLLETPHSYDDRHKETLAQAAFRYVRTSPENQQKRYAEVQSLLCYGTPLHTAFLRETLENVS